MGAGSRGFAFPLPTLVVGLNACGKEFTEDTVLSYINHLGSSFCLNNPVSIGTRLKLIIHLPEKLSQDKKLKLVIRGKVAKAEVFRERPAGQKVTVRFEGKYVIKPET